MEGKTEKGNGMVAATSQDASRAGDGGRRFSLGAVVATPGVGELISSGHVDTRALLRRHARGDWGDVGEFDGGLNDAAVAAGEDGGRVLSAYETPGGRVWVITEADRSATTFLLPDEY